ncbi:hypothetical protein [Variovorax sp. J31P207]|uniref:hypothetical protein n=1 Tax=Variovorax sp. J31P207 TaxID=3053510 RepID=UPI002576104A|nr:hypothetical protein [Variovorax sp. J31P207]MDM0068377.1 hypothetical protein [Variovorax sp. J31P207]
MIQSISTHSLSSLFYAPALTPTPLLESLALPERLTKLARIMFVESIGGPRWKSTPGSGAQGNRAWYFDAGRSSVVVTKLAKNIGDLGADEHIALVDALIDEVHDREVRAAILRDVVSIVETAGASPSEFAELTAYARAAGM